MPAIEAGIRPSEFWEMGLDEVQDVIQADINRQNQEAKRSANMAMIISKLIAGEMTPILTGKRNDLYLWDFMPELFEDEKKAFEEEKEKAEIEKIKESRRAFAQRLRQSKKFKKKKEDATDGSNND